MGAESLAELWADSRADATAAERQTRKRGGREKREGSLQSSEGRLLGGPGRQEKWRPQH